MKNLFDVTGKTVLITGASRGIGKSLALGFRDAGAIVYGTGTSEKSIDWMEKETINGRVLNFMENTSSKELFSEIKSNHKKLDVLINNAGISSHTPASMMKEEEMDRIISINFKAVFQLCQEYYRSHKHIGGNIINISSVLGMTGFTLASVYSGTKGAVIQLTKALVAEWGDRFKINSLCPGFIETEMTENIQGKGELMDQFYSKIPLKRMGKPEELLGAAIFLASDASSYITASTLVVDGGMTGTV
jgi:3-oxoacyl-[acyl-carrier protein] reductase